MDTLEIETVSYRGNMFIVTIIPNVFSCNTDTLTIGSETLNHALYDDIMGYRDEEARWIDEQIYAYVDDAFFELSQSSFIAKVKGLLD